MKELISIIVPIYNAEKYVKKCLNSILKQTYSNLEIILVDDGSTDESGKICDEYSNKDKRIKVVHKKNGGMSEARNVGLKIASGEYIGFVDSDDYINKNMIKNLYDLLNNENADISICAYELLKENDNPKLKKNGDIVIFNNIDGIKEVLKSKIITSHCWNKLYKKELWECVEFPKKRKFEDLAIMYLIFEKAKKIVYKDEVEYYYVKRVNSIMKTIDEGLVNDLRDMSLKRAKYINRNIKGLEKYVDISEAKRIKMCYDYIIIGKLDNLYNSKEYIEDYNKLKEYIKKYKFELINTQINLRKKIELCVLCWNRNLYKKIVSIFYKKRVI